MTKKYHREWQDVLAPGSRVLLGHKLDIKATVSAVLIREDYITYEVVYWKEADRIVTWVEEREITLDDSYHRLDAHIGFATPKEK